MKIQCLFGLHKPSRFVTIQRGKNVYKPCIWCNKLMPFHDVGKPSKTFDAHNTVVGKRLDAGFVD